MRRRLLGFSGLLLAAGLLAACSSQPAGQGAQPGVNVQGTLTDPCGQPIAYTTVYVPGHAPTLTDAQGHFAISNVQTPYDLVIEGVTLVRMGYADANLLVFRGLTKAQLSITAWRPGQKYCSGRSVIAGTLTSDRGSGPHYGVAAMAAGFVAAQTRDFSDNPDSYSLTLHYPAGTSQATLFAAEWEGNRKKASSFLGYQAYAVTLDDNVDQDITFDESNLTTGTLEVTLQAPPVYTLESLEHSLAYQGQDTGLVTHSVYYYHDQTTPSFPEEVKTLVAPDVSAMLKATASYGRGGYKGLGTGAPVPTGIQDVGGEATVWKRVASDAGSATLSFPDPVIPLVPLSGAQIDPKATFRWQGPEGAVNLVWFYLENDWSDLLVQVVTAGHELSLPSFPDLGVGAQGYARGVWWVLGFGLPGISDADGLADRSAEIAKFYKKPTSIVGDEGYLVFSRNGYFLLPGASAGGGRP